MRHHIYAAAALLHATVLHLAKHQLLYSSGRKYGNCPRVGRCIKHTTTDSRTRVGKHSLHTRHIIFLTLGETFNFHIPHQ